MSLGNKHILAKNLQRYMAEQEKDRQRLCKDLGIKYSTLAEWVSGNKYPRIDKIEMLANYFGIQKSDLIEEKSYGVATEAIPQYPFIPEGVAAGDPCTIEGMKNLPTIGISDTIMGKYKRNKNIVIMKVNGESMNRIVPNGSFVVVKIDYPITSLKDEDMVVFNHSHEYSLKHFYRSGGRLVFKPCSKNPTFTDIVFDESEEVTIVGKVVMYMVSLE